MNRSFVGLDVCVVFPRQVDRQIYPAPALAAFFPYVVYTFHLPAIVMDDVPICHCWALEDSFLIVEDDRYMVEAYPLVARRWLKAHH